jgi:membrane protease YdiL (CAAX protease family)
MTSEGVRIAIALALLMALLLLRIQSELFCAAEYDEPDNRFGRGFWTRLAWYGLGLAAIGGIYYAHPQPHDMLYLVLGGKREVLAWGLALGAVGAGLSALIALVRYGSLRLPAPRAYPGAAINSVATAVIDEATFRGVLQGLLLAIGLPTGSAIAVQTVVYALATRSAAPGRPRSMLVMAVFLGAACGWATISTEGIGAAILAHTVTSFALFVCTGHAGHVARRGEEPEEVAAVHKPEGWTPVPPQDTTVPPQD